MSREDEGVSLVTAKKKDDDEEKKKGKSRELGVRSGERQGETERVC